VPDKIEKGLQAGIAGSFGGLFLPLGDLVKKSQDLVWGQRAQLPVTELAIEPGQDELVRADTIFFFEFASWYSKQYFTASDTFIMNLLV
jgi:hypothetical protein